LFNKQIVRLFKSSSRFKVFFPFNYIRFFFQFQFISKYNFKIIHFDRTEVDFNFGHKFQNREIEDAPYVILYAVAGGNEFKDFHTVLSDLAKQKKINYSFRHKIEKSKNDHSIYLSGYGVELAIKSTEYKVVDEQSNFKFHILFFQKFKKIKIKIKNKY